jgi:streptogramin lyase
MRFPVSVLLWLPAALSLTGCGISDSAAPLTAPGPVLQGIIHGGQQPVVGAKIYVLAANPVSGGASIPLLSAAKTGNAADSIGSYVLSGAGGVFNISTDYSCTAGQPVYLYVLGGNTGSGNNSAAGFLTVLGNCPATGTFPSTTNLFINEVTTVVSAYALAPFATDATHVSYTGTALGLTGIQNAFASVANLVSLSTGTAYATTPNGNATVPQATINTLGNILATCINATGPTNGGCPLLFAAAKSAGSNGTTATDTATAAINIAHYPAANPSILYTLQAGVATPFLPDITSTNGPADFTLQLNYTGGGIAKPEGIAVDAAGSVWVANYGYNYVSKILASGAFAPNSPFTGGGLGSAAAVAIDANGNAWIGNINNSTLSEFTNSGTAMSPVTGYFGGGIAAPDAIAFDANGYVWVGNSTRGACVSEFTAAGIAVPYTGAARNGCSATFGVAIDASGDIWAVNNDGSAITELAGTSTSTPGGYLRAAGNGGITSPVAVAIDSSSHVWVANGARGSTSVSEYSATSTGTNVQALSGPSGSTGGGLAVPYAVAVDGAGNIWFANSGGPSLTEFSRSGSALTPAATSTTNGGYIGTNTALSTPYALAVDGSGNVWLADEGSSTVIEFYGIGAPVVTPIVASLRAPYGTPGVTP